MHEKKDNTFEKKLTLWWKWSRASRICPVCWSPRIWIQKFVALKVMVILSPIKIQGVTLLESRLPIFTPQRPSTYFQHFLYCCHFSSLRSCVCLSVCLSIMCFFCAFFFSCLSACLYSSRYVSLSMSVSIDCMSVCLCFCFHMLVCLCLYLSVFLSACVCLHLVVCVCLSVSVFSCLLVSPHLPACLSVCPSVSRACQQSLSAASLVNAVITLFR